MWEIRDGLKHLRSYLGLIDIENPNLIYPNHPWFTSNLLIAKGDIDNSLMFTKLLVVYRYYK